VNGGRPQDNNFTLDGFDSNMQMMNSPGISPPMDALQEFKVATNTGSEFGRSMGANVSMVIKSGTSRVHGTAYEFLRNNVLDANEFFANRNGLPKVPFRQNQYGVAIGGPIPKLASGRMFWFASWEGFRRRRSSTQIGNVPTAAFLQGDFSQLLSVGPDVPAVIRITDPLNGNAPFPNNVIPTTRINRAIPTAFELTTPLPNRPGLVQNYVASGSQANNRDALHWRYDYNINEKNSFFFRFSLQNADLLSPALQPNFVGRSEFDVFNYGASWTHIFSPTTTLEVGFGTNQPNIPGITAKGSLTRAEFLSKTGMQMYQTEVFGDPLVNITIGSYGTPGAGGGVQGDNIWQGRGNLNKVMGKHSLKFGGQYQHRQFYTNTSNPMNGDAIFQGGVAGYPRADALLGYPGEVRRGEGNTLTDGISHFLIGHVQDDWRVTSNLTINVGLMYQFGSRPYDTTDRLGNLVVLRDETTGAYSGRLLWATTNPQPNPDTGELNSPPPPRRLRSRAGPQRQERFRAPVRLSLQGERQDRRPRGRGHVLQLHVRAGASGSPQILAVHRSTGVQPEPRRRARSIDHRAGARFLEHIRDRRMAAESGQSFAVFDPVELLHPAPTAGRPLVRHRLRRLCQPQADRLRAFQQRTDAGARADSAPPPATELRGSRRWLQSVLGQLQCAANESEKAVLARPPVQRELHLAEVARQPVLARREPEDAGSLQSPGRLEPVELGHQSRLCLLVRV
jgi:hypothetical protein